jgi:hypothetical protein
VRLAAYRSPCSGIKGHLLLLKKYAKELEAFPKIRNYQHKKIAIHYFKYGEMAEVRKHLVYSIKAYPLDIGAYVYLISSILGRWGFGHCVYTIKRLGSFLSRSFPIK